MKQPRPARRPFRALARAVSWHRRKLAVLAAIAAVLTGVSAANPPSPPTVPVLRATTQLAGGAVVRSADLQVDDVVRGDAPVGALSDAADVVGKILAGPVAEGQMLTGLSLVSVRTALPRGHVVAPLRLADSDLAALLRPGETIDVVVADSQSEKATVVATGVRVVTIPAVTEKDPAQSGALVLVEVDSAQAAVLARAAVSGTLTVLWR
jgi:pilus assembly protein CpaB